MSMKNQSHSQIVVRLCSLLEYSLIREISLNINYAKPQKPRRTRLHPDSSGFLNFIFHSLKEGYHSAEAVFKASQIFSSSFKEPWCHPSSETTGRCPPRRTVCLRSGQKFTIKVSLFQICYISINQ